MIYAIHKETKKHRLIGSVAMAENEWELVQADADGWIPWEGGECPLPSGVFCEVMLRGDGNTHKRSEKECNDWIWGHLGVRSDITAYRPILGEPSGQRMQWCLWR